MVVGVVEVFYRGGGGVGHANKDRKKIGGWVLGVAAAPLSSGVRADFQRIWSDWVPDIRNVVQESNSCRGFGYSVFEWDVWGSLIANGQD